MPKVLSKECFLPYDEKGRPAVPGFVTYVANDKPVLIHRFGREDYSDAYDDYMDMFSHDNGRTWTQAVLHLKSKDVEGGKIRYGEQAAFFDPDTEKLIVVINKSFYPKDTLDTDLPYSLVQEVYDPATNTWSDLTPLDLNFPGGVAVSFCNPLKTSRGRLVFPAQSIYLDEKGKPIHYRGCWSSAGIIVHILGDYREDGTIRWRLSKPVIPDLEKTSRGFYEPAVAELENGRFVMVLRGDNSMFPERPGYKWVSFSNDQCETWTTPVPLTGDDGEPIESSSTGSALFRSVKNGRLYWIGNLCLQGVRPNGNFPREPLYIVEVQEEPFALKRNTITVIDRREPGESHYLQLSNFRFYQDRETGDIVLFLTRYGENSTDEDWAKTWMFANYYRYRIAIE
ncbi:MAG: glycoside hydrolase [Crenarchaeota archaeon]|nr:glycoside hydrolase [Thermoproteota archaeon]